MGDNASAELDTRLALAKQRLSGKALRDELAALDAARRVLQLWFDQLLIELFGFVLLAVIDCFDVYSNRNEWNSCRQHRSRFEDETDFGSTWVSSVH